MSCNNDFLVCIEKSNKEVSKPHVNKLYEKIFNNIIQKIKRNKEMSNEDLDFIESSSCKQKMVIIQEYNKKQKENIQIIEATKSSGLK